MHAPAEPPPGLTERAAHGRRLLHLLRWLFLLVFTAGGLSAAAYIHFNGLPLPEQASSGSNAIALVKRRPPPPPVVEPPPIVIRAVGDVVLGSNYPKYRLPGEGDKQRIAALHHTLNDADIVVGNLEGVLYDHGKSRKDVRQAGLFTFRMPESYAATLHDMGFDVLSLANNHSMDFGAEGLQATERALRAAGIQPVGVPGAELAVVTVRGTRVAFLNYSYLPTFVRLDNEPAIRAEIDHARSVADLVMVTVHAGREGESAAGTPEGDEYFMNEYRGNIRKFAQFAIDAGASAVFGHGPHVVRPFELYQGRPIFFSLGNFVGYRSLSTRGKMGSSIVAEVRFSPKGKLVGAGVIPLKMDKTGIPSADYSMPTLSTLDGLLAKQLEKRPVLELALPQPASAVAAASAPSPHVP